MLGIYIILKRRFTTIPNFYNFSHFRIADNRNQLQLQVWHSQRMKSIILCWAVKMAMFIQVMAANGPQFKMKNLIK